MISLTEKVIGQVSDSIRVIISLDKTKHAGERQSRHADDYISEEEIKEIAEESVKTIAKQLLFNKLDVGDFVHIHDSQTDINLVGKLEAKGNVINFIIITVMVKRNFKAKSGTKTITI